MKSAPINGLLFTNFRTWFELVPIFDRPDYVYLLKSPAGTRLIGGSTGLLPDWATYVQFHSPFPRIVISFVNQPVGIFSRIVLRKSGKRTGKARTWQAALPVTRLHIPNGLCFGQAETYTIPEFDELGKTTIDLTPLLGIGAEDRAFHEASDLIFKLGGVLGKYPQIEERIARELGVRLLIEQEDQPYPE